MQRLTLSRTRLAREALRGFEVIEGNSSPTTNGVSRVMLRLTVSHE